MKGIAQAALLLLCSSRLARWLLIIGLILTGIGLVAMVSGGGSAAVPLFAVALIIGMPAAVISPVLLGPMIFRSFSAPRAISLIPSGRLQLVMGALAAQLLLALFIATVVTALRSHPSPLAGRPAQLAPVFVVTFAILTLHFIGYYRASRYRFGGLWFLGLAQGAWMFKTATGEWHLGNPFATASGLSATLAISLLAWMIFAIVHVRARLVHAPHWNNSGMGTRSAPVRAFQGDNFVTHGPRRYTQSEALALLLSGAPSYRLSPAIALLGLLILLSVVAIAVDSETFRRNWLAWGWFICLFTGPVAWGNTSRLAAHSKLLWMPVGLEREELFRQIEARSWRLVFGFTALGIVLAATSFGLSVGPRHTAVHLLPATWAIAALVIPLASGAACTYAGLQYVRGRRLPDVLILSGCIALWMLEMICVVAGAGVQTVTALLAIQIVLVAPLRALALRRWQNIDWVIYKPLRNAAGVG